MKDLLKNLKEKRLDTLETKTKIAELKTKLYESELGQEILNYEEWLQHAMVDENLAELKLRTAVINNYNNTQEKNPLDKVKVIIQKKVEYDLADAYDFASVYAPKLLILNVKEFENHAKAVSKTLPIRFVKITDEPAVRIAKEL